MDKWQEREAQRLAADEGVSEAEARGRLFPAAEAEGDKEPPAEVKVSTRKR